MPSSLPPSPSPPHIAGLITFECVARHLNFARAAEEIGVTPTAVSKSLKKLEGQLRVRLFNRTTRSVGLTEEGRRLLQSLGPALRQVRLSVQQVQESATTPRGVLRLNTSYVAFASLIAPYQAEFCRQFPDITLDITIDNVLADIVAAGFDVGIRLGHVLQHDMIAVALGPPQPMAVVAAPAYLSSRGTPQLPAQLADHECLRQRIGAPARPFEWRFRDGNDTFTVPVKGQLVYNDMRCTKDAANAGIGLAYVFRQLAEPELKRNELVAVLEAYCIEVTPFYLYYSNREQMSPKVRVFIDFFREANRATDERPKHAHS